MLPLYPETRILKIFTGSAAYCMCSIIGRDISDKNHADPNSLEPILDSDIGVLIKHQVKEYLQQKSYNYIPVVS